MKKLEGADTAVFALFSNLEESNGSLRGLYEGRLRSRVRDVEGIKRKWEELTGQPVPKKLKTDEFQSQAAAAAAKPPSNSVKSVKTTIKPVTTKPVESIKPAATPAIVETAESISKDVNSLSYNDIRKQLKDRSISCVGKKPELVERLVNAKMKELMREETKRKKEILFGKEYASNGSKETKNEGQKESVVAAGVNMEKESVVPSQKVDDVEMKDVAEKEAPVDQKATITAASSAAAKPAPKSALKPSKFALAKAKAASPAKFKLAKFSKDKEPTVDKELPINTTILPKEKISSGSESSKSNSSASGVSKSSCVSGGSNASNPAVMQTTPSFKTAPLAKGDSGVKALEKKKDIMASKESRAAKIAEMRERVKNTKAITSSATKTYSSTSIVTSTASLKSATKPVPGSETKTNPLIAKMREKAAAEKAGAPISTLAAFPKPIVSSTASVSSLKLSTPQIKSSPPKPHQSSLKSMALKQMMDPANKAPVKKEEKPLSPMQTYEMSDREEESSSDEDSDVESVDKPKKTIPDWAQRSNLHRALILQFDDGPNRLDPDKIFGEVETCNLEQIFGDVKSKKRYHKRTSSGNWTKDHVTIAEKLAYKRSMGYNQS